MTERRPPTVVEDPSSLDEYLVDQLFEEDADLLSQDNGLDMSHDTRGRIGPARRCPETDR